MTTTRSCPQGVDKLSTSVARRTSLEMPEMATVLDVAAYILNKQGEMSAMKLEKLCYYSKAWHLVWEERPLFSERIEAWANGPVTPVLYRAHRGRFLVDEIPAGDMRALDNGEKESIDIVLASYGERSAHFLSELSHREDPWRKARRGVPDGARSRNEITDAALMEYFDSQTTADAPF